MKWAMSHRMLYSALLVGLKVYSGLMAVTYCFLCLEWSSPTSFWNRFLFNGCVVVWSLSHVWLFCNPMDCGPPGSSICGIFQARILESPCPSPGDLPDPGNKPASPALQADSLPLSFQWWQLWKCDHHCIRGKLTLVNNPKKTPCYGGTYILVERSVI